MKTAAPSSRGAAAGFSLIELIGVLAIMAILASVIVPNVLHGVDRAAENAEAQTLANLGQQVSSYLRDKGAAPDSAGWSTELAAYASLSPAAILTNPRGQARVYLADPDPSNHEILILSNLRAGLNLPAASAITTDAAFQAIWQTASGAVPAVSSWGGWNAWNRVAGSGNFLVIARVSLQPVYDAMQPFTIALNNQGSAAASYTLVPPNGSALGPFVVRPGVLSPPLSQAPGVVINLFTDSNGTNLNFSYVVSTTGKTFTFNGTNWTPL